MQEMKMLFSSRDAAQIEHFRQKLVAAGIRCEIRESPFEAQERGADAYAELWVQSDPDYHTASILYASPVRVLRQQASGPGKK